MPNLVGWATIGAFVIGFITLLASIVMLAVRISRWKQEIHSDHQEVREAHTASHRDIERIADAMDEGVDVDRARCPTCPDVDETVDGRFSLPDGGPDQD